MTWRNQYAVSSDFFEQGTISNSANDFCGDYIYFDQFFLYFLRIRKKIKVPVLNLVSGNILAWYTHIKLSMTPKLWSEPYFWMGYGRHKISKISTRNWVAKYGIESAMSHKMFKFSLCCQLAAILFACYYEPAPLKVSKHENFSLAFFALSEPIWVGD
jgi:hypothetical protein